MQKTKEQVTKLANELADILNKRYGVTSWKPHVWHNLYWCYSVHSGSISVTKHTDVAKVDYYTAMLSSTAEHAGTADTIWFDNDICSARHPWQAVDNALAHAQKIISEYQDTINRNLKILGKK